MTHLRIENFNTIESIDLPLKDLLIFIGAQASGKSTISKAIYFFKSLRDDLSIYLQEECYAKGHFDTSIATFAKQAKQKFIKIYGTVNQFPNLKLYYSDPVWDLKTPHPQPLSQGGRGEQEYSDFTADRYSSSL